MRLYFIFASISLALAHPLAAVASKILPSATYTISYNSNKKKDRGLTQLDGLPLDKEMTTSTPEGRELLKRAMEKTPQIAMLLDLTQRLVSENQDVRDALFATMSKILELRGELALQEHEDLSLAVELSDNYWPNLKLERNRDLRAQWVVRLIRKSLSSEKEVWFLLPGPWSVLAAGAGLALEKHSADEISFFDPKINPPPASSLDRIQSIKDAPAVDTAAAKVLFKKLIEDVVADAPTWTNLKKAVDKYEGWLKVIETPHLPSLADAIGNHDRVPKFSIQGFSSYGYKNSLALLQSDTFVAALEKLKDREKSKSGGFVIFVSHTDRGPKVHLLYWTNKPDLTAVSPSPGLHGPTEVNIEEAAKWVEEVVSRREIPKKIDAILKGFNE